MGGGSSDGGVGFSDGRTFHAHERNRNSSGRLAKILGLCILTGIAVPVWNYLDKETIRTRVTDAQMTKVDGRYMIATEVEPFENHDAYYRFKFNSGSIQNDAIKLKGKEVELKVYGWRIPLFSAYRNVCSIREVSQ